MSATAEKTEFEDYKMIHNFMYDEPLKRWMDETNFINNYNSDIVWAMSVLEKIGGIKNPQNEDEFLYNWTLTQSYCSIESNIINGGLGEGEIVRNNHGGSLAQMIYVTVVQFIKWYNKQ